MTKKKKKSGQKLTAKNLQIELLKFLLTQPKKQFAPRQLAGILHIDNNKDSIEHALHQLTQAGSVREFKQNKFGVALDHLTVEEDVADKPAKTAREKPMKTKAQRFQPTARQQKTVEGRVDMTRTGAAYIVTDQLDADVFVAPRYVNGALNGDQVSVLLFPQKPRRGKSADRRPEGEVLKVLKRANEFFIGTLRKSRKYAMLLPDNPNMPVDIYIPLEACGDAKDGEKVVARVTDWQDGKGRVPIGQVTQTLGAVGGNDFEMKKILINAGFELIHSEEALAEADRIPMTVPSQEIERRRDFRDVLTFTIDPEDAKDFDDALSIRKLENGNLEVGIHIADVTHYLKPDTPLDREAFRRSTSVYLVDRVNPMLPEKLSNHLCSLVPYEDRLTFSAVFEFNSRDSVVSRWFGKTVIHSDKRFTYEEAQSILDDQPGEGLQQLRNFRDLDWAVRSMARIARTMRKAREKEGAIGFESDEVRFRLAEDGTPIEAYVKDRIETNLLIEDFMLLANKEVALFIDRKAASEREIPFVYRVHDLPDMEKVQELARFAREMGHPMKVSTPKQIAQSYNHLMKAARKDERLKLLEPLAIRTMAKAVYSTSNIGHYGLGFSHYSHFTSPIRRYADVLAHRLLERNLDGRTYRMDKSKLEEQCKHVSSQEKKAADAERESIKYKQAELMRRHLGETFEGYVSGMIERGFFVELPDSLAEGLVDFRYLDDTYILEEGGLSAKGRRYKNVIKMGDKVRIRITGVDLQKRQIEMELVE
ncbi:MAG: ribonuclease R [Bacteroidetes bacterium]|nr:MAG: ribonuclease R [Bacteroidota bacterium]